MTRSNSYACQWIPVTKRLPRNDKPVLVAYNAMWKPSRQRHWSVHIVRYAGGQWRFLTTKEKTRKPERIRFWMPLPTAPRATSRPEK